MKESAFASVLIVEDDIFTQQRFRNILLELGYRSHELIMVSHLKKALELSISHEIALAIVDLRLVDGNGLNFIEKLHEHQPNALSLVVSAWSTRDVLFLAIQAGASGYLLKERDDLEISIAIRSVLRGGAPIDPFIAQEILTYVATQKKQEVCVPAKKSLIDEVLTARENQTLVLVAQGLSNREIAEKLFVSRYTVESHIKHIYRKLSVTKRTQAVNTARSLGIL